MGKTVADSIVERLAARGVRYMFGVPGGDCNLDIIEAGARAGVEFVLTRDETAAAITASVTAELTGTPGVVMTTRGPGLANAANGVAYASLDRAPLLIIADNYEDGLDHVSHQRLDQAGLLRPVLKAASRLEQDDPAAEVDALLDTALAQPPGPVYLEITGARVRAPAPVPAARAERAPAAAPDGDGAAWAAAERLLASARRPILIAGLQARAPAAAAALRRFVSRYDCPVLLTYKAKGVISDADPHALGCYIGGAAEHAALSSSDLIILYGFDPIEGPPAKWRYDKRLLEFTEHRFDHPLVTADVSIVGPLAVSLDRIRVGRTHAYAPAEFSELQRAIRERAAAGGAADGAISPQQVVDSARAALPADCRIVVDAGAHMLPVLHLWTSHEPNATLVSRGLATMGFALPAAIASAMVEPERPVVAFTGDGGLMMCISELATAVQRKLKLLVIVFNDSCLTLIEAKQRRRQLPNAGVNLSPVNFASVAEGFGCAGFRVERPGDLRDAIAAAHAAEGPAVVDAVVDPHAYYEQIISLRG